MTESRVAYRTHDGYSWDVITRRLESCARGNGTRIITISVVVSEGLPVHWTKPEVTSIEPASKADRFVALLTGEA